MLFIQAFWGIKFWHKGLPNPTRAPKRLVVTFESTEGHTERLQGQQAAHWGPHRLTEGPGGQLAIEDRDTQIYSMLTNEGPSYQPRAHRVTESHLGPQRAPQNDWKYHRIPLRDHRLIEPELSESTSIPLLGTLVVYGWYMVAKFKAHALTQGPVKSHGRVLGP